MDESIQINSISFFIFLFFFIIFLVLLIPVIVKIFRYIKTLERDKIIKRLSRIKDRITLYFNYFGWVLIFFICILVIVYFLLPKLFPWVLTISVLLILIIQPIKFVYSLVGARNSLRTFFLLFIFTQLLFSLLYFSDIHDFQESDKSMQIKQCITEESNKEPNDALKNNAEYCLENTSKNDFSYRYVVLNTFYIALVQETSPSFQQYIEKEDSINKDRFFIIINIHILISWIYLGVFIASLYQKLRNE
jgi:hypothetical protein